MPKTLLLADDSVTIQKVVGISFANEDIRLITVDNGDAALARARQDRPDVILADVVMPGKSGYEVCEAVKADPNLRHIPVLLLTGTFEAFDEARATRAGAAGHVAKPFESQQLVAQVKRLLVQSEQQRNAPPPPPPAAPSASVDDSFEFFNEDVAEPAAPPARADAGSDDAFSLDENDSSFAFGDSELSTLEPEPAPAARAHAPAPAAGERTVAILPDETPAARPPAAADPFAGLDVGEETDAGEFAPLDAPISAGSDAFEFELDPRARSAGPDGSLPVDSDDLAQATVLDPNGASGFDVATSDLEGSFEAPARREPAAEAQEPVVSPEDSFAGLHDEIADASEFGSLDDNELDESSLEVLAPPRPAETAHRAPAPAAAVRPDRSSDVEPLLEALAPQLRAQLHDTLEKIAWESFSNVTEQIVRQALERVEAIAWEVIPQMAETLVREEIRRMKGKVD
jgi:CheY-like chemotaxis protein